MLQAKILKLCDRIAVLEFEINRLQQDETYQLIQAIDDLDDYFSELETELQAELKAMKN